MVICQGQELNLQSSTLPVGRPSFGFSIPFFPEAEDVYRTGWGQSSSRQDALRLDLVCVRAQKTEVWPGILVRPRL